MRKLILALVLCTLSRAAWAEDPPATPSGPLPFDRARLQDVLRKNPLEALKARQGVPQGPAAAATATSGSTTTKPATPRATAPASTASAASTSKASTPRASVQEEVAQEIDVDERAKKSKVNFEFNKADIMAIVKLISELYRINFIIPEKLKGQNLTILSPTQITPAEAYQVFLAALAANGISLVKVGNFYKLVESKDARKEPIPTCITPDEQCPKFTEQMVTQLVSLKYVDGNQITNILKGLLGKDGEITIYAPTNALIISEYATNLQRLRHIIDALDLPGFEDELQLVQIRYATATEIAGKIKEIFETSGSSAAAKAKPGAPSRPKPAAGQPDGGHAEEAEVSFSKVIADDRTNQLIVKADRGSFAAIKAVIAKLDVPVSESEQGKVHVHYLANASAEDLGSTLSSLAQGSKPAGAAARPKGGEAESAVLFEGEVKITADKSTNSLIIVASAHDFRSLKKIIEKLDLPRRQVYVEAAILEVTVSGDDQFGMDWHRPVPLTKQLIGPDLGGPDTFGFLQSARKPNEISPTIGALSNAAGLLGVAGGAVAGVLGKGIDLKVGDQTLSIPSFGVILRWLESSSNAQVLSTPHILTTDNEEASIEVGTKIPFQRGTALPGLGNLGNLAGAAGGSAGNLASSLGSLGNMFSSTDRIDVSLQLKLTPQINERNKVRMEIEQNIEDLVGKDEDTGQPITASRKAKTTVVVDDQQTVVLGGLMRDRTRQSESRVPILGDLPLIGALFRSESTETEKVNLLLVLTPYIIRESADFQRIFERKIEEYEQFAADYYGAQAGYRAHIDYAHKNGPLALLSRKVKDELNKIENGGSGEGEETLVGPGGAQPVGEVQSEPILIPKRVGAGSGDGSASEAPPPPEEPGE